MNSSSRWGFFGSQQSNWTQPRPAQLLRSERNRLAEQLIHIDVNSLEHGLSVAGAWIDKKAIVRVAVIRERRLKSRYEAELEQMESALNYRRDWRSLFRLILDLTIRGPR